MPPSIREANVSSRSARFFSEFARGLSVPFDGLKILSEAPRLWFDVWQPVLINTLLTLLVSAGAFFASRSVLEHYRAQAPEGWWNTLLAILVVVTVVIITLAVAFATYVLLQAMFCGIFFSRLARKVELHLGTSAAELVEPPITAQIVDAIRACVKLLIGNLLLLFLHLIPFVGSVLALSLGLYLDAYLLGAEFIGYPLELRGVRWLQRQTVARRHLGLTLGVGTMVSLFVFVPLLGAILQATAVIGTVVAIHRLQEELRRS